MREGIVDRPPILIAMIAGTALQGAALAQSTMPAGDVQRFACENDGLLAGTPFRMSAGRAHYGCRVCRRTDLLAPAQF